MFIVNFKLYIYYLLIFSHSPEMAETILGAILPKMLVAGFITESIASVIMAGLVAIMI